MKRTFIILLIAICLGILHQPVAAQILKRTDERIAKALDQAKTPYNIDQNGEYKVTFAFPDKRTQIVFISSKTQQLQNIEMRMIYTFAMISDKAPSQEIANLLLQENSAYPQTPGFWSIAKMEDNKFLTFYSTYVPAACDAKTLDEILNRLVAQADEMEARITKQDKH